MRLVKKGFSYIAFFISAIILSVISIMLICDTINSLRLFNLSFNNSILNILFVPFISVLVLVIAILFLLLLRFARTKLIKKYNSQNIVRRCLHFLVFAAVLCFGVYFRYKNVLANSKTTVVYDVVRKIFNHEPTYVTETLNYFYLSLVTFICRFVGLKENVFLWTNLVLETISACLIYLSVKRIFGRFPALGSFSAYMLLSASYFNVVSEEGYSLLIFFAAICFYGFSFLLMARYNHASDNNGHITWFIILGLLTGFIAYLHVSALILWIFILALIFIYRPATEDNIIDEKPEDQIEKYGEVIEYPDFVYDDDYTKESIWYSNKWPVILYLLFSFIAFFGMFYIDSKVYSLNFLNILWENGYLRFFDFNLFNRFIPGNYTLEISVLLIITCLGAVAFWFHSTDNISAFSIGLLALLPIFIFAKNTQPLYAVSLLFIGAYFGNGIEFLLFRKPRSNKVSTADTVDNNKAFENIEIKESINTSDENENKFIENVLPVPKKHVRKELDYSFEPSEEKMKFDIEISDDDDFDVL